MNGWWNQNAEEMVAYYTDLARYPLISIEDGLDENDWDDWAQLTTACQIFNCWRRSLCDQSD